MSRQLVTTISVEQAVQIINKLIQPKRLNDVQDLVLRHSYLGQTYEEIAESSGYSIQHIRDVGYKLWKLLSKVLGEKVTKSNIHSILSQYLQHLNSTGEGDDLLISQPLAKKINPSFPEGPVSIDSPLYIDRPPIEEQCYAAIASTGALIRIKAPKQMGKTSLTLRIMARAASLGYHTARLNLSQAELPILGNLDKFLRWFCANVSRQLMLESKINDYWDEDLGSKVSCTAYVQGYLLQHLNCPLVLALDELDRIFEFPETAAEFLPLLRFWHEEANNIEVWQKLRLIVVHSTEVYIPLNINQSPFNVGLPIKLPELTIKQVQQLAKLYDSDWTDEVGIKKANSLLASIGGHPYLLQLAFYHLASQNITLEKLLQEAPTRSGIYNHHLRRHLANIETNPELAAGMKKVVMADTIVELESIIAYKLDSMGLVKLHQNKVTPSCQLYALYFRSELV
ncbi:MAG: AAA-like domain-containing protein [Prochloraceae cyanobacterium]|nr:AAA-like domain-containing protein [Prochloraceae cyanobacterium]